MNTSSSILPSSSSTTSIIVTTTDSSSLPSGVPFTNSLASAQRFFPADFDYLFSNDSSSSQHGFDLNALNITQIIAQSIGSSAALTVSPTAGFDVSRAYVMSRIANCPERDPLYEQGQVRWIHREVLDFPDTLLPISFFGFGPPESRWI